MVIWDQGGTTWTDTLADGDPIQGPDDALQDRFLIISDGDPTDPSIYLAITACDARNNFV